MALVAEDGIRLVLGDKWLPAIVPFQLLSVAGMFMVIGASLPPVFNALGRPDVNLRYTAVCVLLFPLGFVLLGRSHGVLGVCLIWPVLYPLVVAGLVHCTRRLTGFSLVDLVRAQLPIFAGVAFMAAVVIGLQRGLDDCSSGCRLTLAIAVGVIAYAAFLLVFARHSVLANVRLLVRELRT
jgi:O-antigen/teichoic acid export membrane protein